MATSTAFDTLPDEIISQIGERFAMRRVGDRYEFRTPFAYPDGSPITVFAIKLGHGEYDLSDRGQASDFAFVSGAHQEDVERHLERLASRCGLRLEDDVLNLRSSGEKLGDSLLSLVSAIQEIGYLAYTQTPA